MLSKLTKTTQKENDMLWGGFADHKKIKQTKVSQRLLTNLLS